MSKNYYVYILIDPRNNLPFYVGKGTGKRYLDHEKEYKSQIDYLASGNSSPEKLLSLKLRIFHDLKQINLTCDYRIIEDLEEEDAFLLEHALIAWFGRKLCGNGILTNLQAGGKNGEILFNEQLLVKIYNRPDLIKIILEFPKLSTDWIAKTIYFYDKNRKGYPFTELGIEWLYQYHRAYEQFALEVVEKLKEYDSVITPFYWIRKVRNKKIKDDSIFIMQNSMELIEGTYLKEYGDEDFMEYIKD